MKIIEIPAPGVPQREPAHDFTFTELLSLHDLLRSGEASTAGVYVWGFLLPSKQSGAKAFLPYYVGKSTHSIRTRIGEHACEIEAGKSLLFNRDFLSSAFSGAPLQLELLRQQGLEGRDSASYPREFSPDATVIWTCHDEAGRRFPLPKVAMPRSRRDELRRHVDFYLENMFITFAADSDTKPIDRKQSSAALAWAERVVKYEVIGEEYVLGNIGVPAMERPTLRIGVPDSLEQAFRQSSTVAS